MKGLSLADARQTLSISDMLKDQLDNLHHPALASCCLHESNPTLSSMLL